MSDKLTEFTEASAPADVAPHWKKALDAMERKNFGYAVKIAQGILATYPGFIDGRKLLRKAQQSVINAEGKKAGLFGTGGPSTSKAKSTAKKDPAAGLALLEKELEKDPGDAGANQLLHDIALQLGFTQTAAFALETVRQLDPENVKVLHKLAAYYLEIDDPAKAAGVYNDILKVNPTDSVANKGAKDSTARASMQKGGWSEDGDIKSMMKSSEEQEALEKSGRSGLTREQLEAKRDELAAGYAEDPNDLRNVKELAGVYEQLEDWANAFTFFNWAYEISNGDVALRQKAGEMRDQAAATQLDDLRAQLKENPDDENLAHQVAEMEAHQQAEAVRLGKERVEQNPTDPKIRYELGLALYNIGEYSEAIPHLQQATRNPHIRTKVLLLLGRTFEKKNMLDLAIKQLEDANSELTLMDGTKKEILYTLGQIHAKKDDKPQALAAFKQIYEVDYGYRDVAKLVEESYA